MYKFAIFNSDGNIVRFGDAFSKNESCLPTETIVYDIPEVSNKLYLLNDTVYEYTELQLLDKLNKPKYFSKWDNSVMAWIDLRSLTNLKENKLTIIKNTALYIDSSPLVISDKSFDMSNESRAELFNKLSLAREAAADGISYTISVNLSDGTDININISQLKNILRLADSRSSLLKSIVRALRAQLIAATTKEQVERINWEVSCSSNITIGIS